MHRAAQKNASRCAKKCIALCKKVYRAVGSRRSESPINVSESRRDDRYLVAATCHRIRLEVGHNSEPLGYDSRKYSLALHLQLPIKTCIFSGEMLQADIDIDIHGAT
ncbi:hypothetical protein OUZ56_002229 [Daphnia magna]|uniref:Uncharacterized protein n=1 Tax=Daphnia magna TaxID=35525 RepID=A0ABR0A506_9CRUS|nr:hypothetical protein OUZ56_002229 [Daphnia magna]